MKHIKQSVPLTLKFLRFSHQSIIYCTSALVTYGKKADISSCDFYQNTIRNFLFIKKRSTYINKNSHLIDHCNQNDDVFGKEAKKKTIITAEERQF